MKNEKIIALQSVKKTEKPERFQRSQRFKRLQRANEDASIDKLVHQKMMEEADEYEKELEADSALDDIEVKPALFDKIVAGLKEEGSWEEEKEEPPLNPALQLSKIDQKALEIGRRKMARGKRYRFIKYGSVAAAFCVCVFAASMTNKANRDVLMGVWKSWTEDSVHIDRYEEGDKTATTSEEEVYRKIEEELGIKPLKFMYVPEGMEFVSGDIHKMDMGASVRYRYQETRVNLIMNSVEGGLASEYALNGTAVDNVLVNFGGIEAAIMGRADAEGGTSYTTEFEYMGGCYAISGSMPLEEFKKLIKNIYF